MHSLLPKLPVRYKVAFRDLIFVVEYTFLLLFVVAVPPEF